jgi:hypothetical protein
MNPWCDYKGPGFEVKRYERVLNVELCYPRNDELRVNTVEVGLMDVRAADSIRVTYDFHRDGWSVLQAAGWNRDQSAGDVMDWQEVAFVRAWARVPEGEQ